MTYWHNKEAQELANKLKGIITVWEQGMICPQEFLLHLDEAVEAAKQASTFKCFKK